MEVKRILVIGLLSFSLGNNLIGKTVISLQKAFDKKYITAKAICTGGLELKYSVSNLLKDSLCINVPAGWRFNSDAGKNDFQDILLTRQEMLVLKPKETKTFNMKGYCCEITKSGPTQGIPYTTGKIADSSLVRLARYLNTHPVDQNTQQYAVWAVSDQKETANIAGKNDSTASLLRSFVSNLKGEPLPWYTLIKKAYVSAYGEIHDYPIRFKATIPYAVAESCYSYCYIVDEKGQTVSEIFGNWLYPESSEYKANFNVAGLKKGEYRLVLENKKESLFEKSFRI